MSEAESDAVQSRKSANSDGADAVRETAVMPAEPGRQTDALSCEPWRYLEVIAWIVHRDFGAVAQLNALLNDWTPDPDTRARDALSQLSIYGSSPVSEAQVQVAIQQLDNALASGALRSQGRRYGDELVNIPDHVLKSGRFSTDYGGAWWEGEPNESPHWTDLRISHFDVCERFGLQYENLPIRPPGEHTHWVPLSAALMWIERRYAVDIDELCRPPLSMFGQSDEHVRESLERAWIKLAQKASVGSVAVRGRPYHGSDTEREERSLTVDDLLNCKWFGWAIGDLSIHLVGAVHRFDPDAEDYDLARGSMVNFSFVRVEREGLIRLWPVPAATSKAAMKGFSASRLKKWLEDQLDSRSPLNTTRAEIEKQAHAEFGISKHAFSSVWRNVTARGRTQWNRHGRKPQG